MATIFKKIEAARGCGYRKKGGLYLVSGGLGSPCGKLPARLDVCPCCGSGVKFTRGFTWITSALFGPPGKCRLEESFFNAGECWECPLSSEGLKMGLLWVGEKFYKTAAVFEAEADRLGVSRRIAAVPHDFALGVTWIALAHIKAIRNYPPTVAAHISPVDRERNPEFSPGVFRVYRPTAIEYVVTGKETEEELDALEKRGLTLVDVVRDIDAQKNFFEAISDDGASEEAGQNE